MQQTAESMVVVRDHTFVVTRELLEATLAYARYFRDSLAGKLADYQNEAEDAQDGRLVIAVQCEIQRAEVVAQDMEMLADELTHLYRWHFERLAEVFCQTRLQLEAERIEDIHVAKIVLRYLMAMLKAENPKFSEEKFINYINGGNNDHPERQQAQGVRRPERRVNPANMA